MKVAFHADDAGLCTSIDKGIADSVRFGVVRSVSLVACGSSLEGAISMVSDSSVGIGAHLTLDEETPISSPSLIPTLVNESGVFHDRMTLLKRLTFTNSISLAEVEIELRQQLIVLQSSGLAITHIDGHGHIHIHPRIAPITASLAREFGIRSVRQPREPWSYWANERPNMRTLNKLAVAAMTMTSSRFFRGRDFNAPIPFYGISHGGTLTEHALSRMIKHAHGRQVIEIMCHPGLAGPDAISKYGSWGYDWEGDLRALTSRGVQDMVTRGIIELEGMANLHD